MRGASAVCPSRVISAARKSRAYNMQVVFATTVVGLVVSAVGLVSLQFKQRWYAKDVNNLDYVARKLNEKNTEA